MSSACRLSFLFHSLSPMATPLTIASGNTVQDVCTCSFPSSVHAEVLPCTQLCKLRCASEDTVSFSPLCCRFINITTSCIRVVSSLDDRWSSCFEFERYIDRRRMFQTQIFSLILWCTPSKDPGSETVLCSLLMCMTKIIQRPLLKLTLLRTKGGQIFTTLFLSPIIWQHFAHKWCIHRMRFSHLWIPSISRHYINEAINKWKYDVSRTTVSSFENSSNPTIQE